MKQETGSIDRRNYFELRDRLVKRLEEGDMKQSVIPQADMLTWLNGLSEEDPSKAAFLSFLVLQDFRSDGFV